MELPRLKYGRDQIKFCQGTGGFIDQGAENKNGQFDTSLAQFDAFFYKSHSEPGDAALNQDPGNLDTAVAISIGFDHCA